MELRANQVYFLLGAVSGPAAGAAGAWLTRRRGWALVAAGAMLSGELAVVALAEGRELLPAPRRRRVPPAG